MLYFGCITCKAGFFSFGGALPKSESLMRTEPGNSRHQSSNPSLSCCEQFAVAFIFSCHFGLAESSPNEGFLAPKCIPPRAPGRKLPAKPSLGDPNFRFSLSPGIPCITAPPDSVARTSRGPLPRSVALSAPHELDARTATRITRHLHPPPPVDAFLDSGRDTAPL